LTRLNATDGRLYWRASNYLSVGQNYVRDKPLLQEPLRRDHIKPRLLGHWGSTAGLNGAMGAAAEASTGRQCSVTGFR
jgi:phosphoketolase